jgi:protein-S-isoprenylcysteine O-methyltransferase Ste14
MTISDATDVAPRTPPTRRRTGHALLNTLLSAAGFALCVVAPAATWTSPRPWVLAAVFLLVHLIGTLRILRANPDLLPERSRIGRHLGQPTADKLLLLAFTATYATMLIISSADGSRWHVWPPPPSAIAWAGLTIFAAGWWLVLRALETNTFAVRVVRHQPERGHRLIDTGVYRVVRHPMYAGLVAVMIAAPLWLASTLGLLLAAPPITILALRILLEERILRQHVPGYVQYTQRVPGRLIPGVW